jgi:hypothetical protein
MSLGSCVVAGAGARIELFVTLTPIFANEHCICIVVVRPALHPILKLNETLIYCNLTYVCDVNLSHTQRPITSDL